MENNNRPRRSGRLCREPEGRGALALLKQDISRFLRPPLGVRGESMNWPLKRGDISICRFFARAKKLLQGYPVCGVLPLHVNSMKPLPLGPMMAAGNPPAMQSKGRPVLRQSTRPPDSLQTKKPNVALSPTPKYRSSLRVARQSPYLLSFAPALPCSVFVPFPGR